MTDQPQNIEAERAVLGACLLTKAAFQQARAILSDDDWYRPNHQSIWLAVCAVIDQGIHAEPVTVAAELTRRGELAKIGGPVELFNLQADVATTSNVGFWANLIVDKAVLRRLIEAGNRISQMAQSVDGNNAADAIDDVIARARDEVSVVSRAAAETNTSVDVYDLLDEQLPLNFLIPGLLTEGERLLLTAGEGIGKSTLLRQILVCAAAGLHPFKQTFMDPIRCMGFDFENGRRLSQDRYAPLVGQARRSKREIERGMLQLDIRPRGVNLLNSGEAAKILRTVERFNPQLIMIGPIYRLHEGDPNDERDARKITVVLDQMREINGAAIISEGHMAKGSAGAARSVNPVGSGLWMRWPEYGYGLVLAEDSDLHQRQVELRAWRGPRDERDWPELLMSGFAAGKPWPWVEVAQPRRSGFVDPYAEEAS